jgi:hypothetical protein
MIIKTIAKQAIDVEVDARDILSDITSRIMIERLKEKGIYPAAGCTLGSLIHTDKQGVGHIVTKFSNNDLLDHTVEIVPEDILKIWKAYITLNHAIYSLEQGC